MMLMLTRDCLYCKDGAYFVGDLGLSLMLHERVIVERMLRQWENDRADQLVQIINRQDFELWNERQLTGQLQCISHILEPLNCHSRQMMAGKVRNLKQGDGEDWAVGEMLQRAIELHDELAE